MRLAVLSDHADQKLCSLLQRGLASWNSSASVYRSDFEDISLEVLHADSAMYAFQPEVVYLNLSTQGIRDRFYAAQPAGRSDVFRDVMEDLSRWLGILLQKNFQVVVNLLPAPVERHCGSFSACLAGSLPNQIRAINHAIVTEIAGREGVLVNDLAHLSASIGLRQWYDERFWCHSKYPCRPPLLACYADSLMAVLKAWRGRDLIKCIITDLDNTLWHGIIGDDGLDGIEVGGVGVGEAHQRYQHYLLTLKQQGIILCVCSKNEEAAARLPFQKHSGMVLKESDFACFMANWKPKSENIRAMAAELNLGLDSFVFVDDSAFEREEVRSALPEVNVPEFPEDASGICALLENLPGLETATRPTEEDLRRTALYQVERQRSLLESQFTSREDFLGGLEMTGVFAPVGDAEISRAAQLIQRSNQFNLRTQRLGTEQLRALASSTSGFACFCSLRDRFGDHGIIAVLCGEVREAGSTVWITEWVMSCRVLGRGVEEFIRNHLVTTARAMNCTKLVGEYLPTEKNAMVAGLYERLGFTRISDGTARFELQVDTATRLPNFINSQSSLTSSI
jgi:FkbH-like protein